MSNLQEWLADVSSIPTHDYEYTAEPKSSSVPLASELNAMDFQKYEFFINLTEQQQKDISTWVLMRYMSSSKNRAEDHLVFTNSIVNVNFNLLRNHKELQWKLLACVGTGTKQYHPWIKPPKGAIKNKIETIILSLNPLMKDKDLELFLEMNTRDDLRQLLIENGYDDKAITEILGKNEKS